MVVLVLLAIQYLPVSAATSKVPGQPANVVLTIIPPKLPADGGVYPAAVISLLDSSNLPTAAFGDVTVFLSSDQTNIAAVPATVTIAAGHTYAIANVTTTTTPGTATITASAQGLLSQPQVSVSVPLTTVTPSGYPSKLLVLASPANFLPRSDRGLVRVEVVDAAGLPSKAITPIPVALSSSNVSIASLGQSSLNIPEGSIFVDGSFATSGTGSAVLTATSTGYTSGAAVVTVGKSGGQGGPNIPTRLALRVIAGGTTGTLPSDGQTYGVLEVSLQTSSAGPATLGSDTVVQLTSDQSGLALVQSLVSIPAGSISAIASITTSALAGVANITATAPSASLLPATVSVKTVIPAPSKLQAYVAPASSAYSATGNYPILVVQLQDSTGNPARARQDTSVVVTSSNGTLLSNFITVGISKGNDYVFSYLHVKGVGTSVLTALTSDLTSSQVSLQTLPSPLAVNLAIQPDGPTPYSGLIYQNESASFTFSAYLDGQPLQNINVTWTSTGGTLSSTTGTTSRYGTSSIMFTPTKPGVFNITASMYAPQTGSVAVTRALTVAQVPTKPAPSLAEQILGFWYYIVAAVAVAVVAVIYLFRMRRKKQRAEIEAGFEVV